MSHLIHFVQICPDWHKKSASEIATFLMEPMRIGISSTSELFGQVKKMAKTGSPSDEAKTAIDNAVTANLREVWRTGEYWSKELASALSKGDQRSAETILRSCPVDFGEQIVDLAVQVLRESITTRAELTPAQVGENPNDPNSYVFAPASITSDDVTAALAERGWQPKASGVGWQRGA